MGHPTGDELLQLIAERLNCVVRQEDTVSRIGGDEFVIVLEAVSSAEQVASVVQKIMKAFSNPFQISGSDLRITASIGITIYPEDGDNTDDLLRNADTAMYRAKQAGRNTYQFYTNELTISAFEHALVESSLRSAIAKNEFQLVYQPQYELGSKRILGMEALLRWSHPELGVVSPARFIPIAEQSGLIQEIGEWVLSTACRQGRRWLDQDFEIGRIAVQASL